VAADAGADFLGFIHFAASPRHVSLDHAADIGGDLPKGGAKRVGVLVDADLESVKRLVDSLQLDFLQLHGPHGPSELLAIRDAVGIPVIKAVGVAGAEDVARAAAFETVAAMMLFDAKAPAGSDRPGGNAVSFPWHIMQDYDGPSPWLLAGGLTPETVVGAIVAAGAQGVDVASGVEDSPGIKSHEKIKAFIRAAKGGS